MGLYLLIPTFVVIVVSILIVRAGAIALRMTGLDQKTASFQALSAFTRAGFTTREAESVVNDPRRRSIVTWLMILGNAGIVAVIVTGTSSLTSSNNYKTGIDIAVLVVGLYLVYRVVRHTGLMGRWEGLVENKLVRGKLFAGIPVEHLLHLAEGYGVARAPVTQGSPLIGSELADSRLPGVDFIVLGIQRSGTWMPNKALGGPIGEGDAVVVYGLLTEIDSYFARDKNAGNNGPAIGTPVPNM